jgi:hypothetical protein
VTDRFNELGLLSFAAVHVGTWPAGRGRSTAALSNPAAMVDLVLLLTTVAPALGVVTAILLFFSPLGAALQAQKDGTLGVNLAIVVLIICR